LTFDIITEVLAVLAVALLVGELFEQVGLPSVAGELLSGIVLGPKNRAFFVPVFFGLAGVEASFPAAQAWLLAPCYSYPSSLRLC
jgi:NhaP-type Na+/H+ or K+/H+ antiporter